jgi:hypothetical protein
MDTDPQHAKFFSSQQTEDSEQQQRAINLGKALVQELGLEPGVDTLSRWIIHYITEQIAIAENATGEAKIEAEKRCFDSIMQLWQHRYALPNGRSPFRDFVSILETLRYLKPDNPEPYYFDLPHLTQQDDSNTTESTPERVRSWLRIALSIDKAAKVMIETFLRYAAITAIDEQTEGWLKHAPRAKKDADVQAIVELTTEPDLDDDDARLDAEKQSIEKRLEYLEEFLEFSNLLRDAFKEPLDTRV